MRGWLLGACGVLLGLVFAACASVRRAPAFPWPASAAAAVAEARTLERLRPPGWLAAAEERARAAEGLAPGWVAPRRVLDDLARLRLAGHGALARRRAALDDGADAAELYLAARLEGRGTRATMERAVALDPTLAWARHGLAWHHSDAGELGAALRAGERALERAAGSYELGCFALALARWRLERGEGEAARALLDEVLARAALVEPERTELGVLLAAAELEGEDVETRMRGLARGAALLAAGVLSAGEYERLGSALVGARARVVHPDPLALWLAALENPGPAGTRAARERLRVRLLFERGERALAGAWLAAAPEGLSAGPFQRAHELERGAARAAIERWRAALPAAVLCEDGLPRLPVLRELVLAARASEDADGALRFGQALLAAGWFAEAESYAVALVSREREAALALRARAAAGQALLAGIRATLDGIDRDERVPNVIASEALAGPVRSLSDLLAALTPLFRAYGIESAESLVDSPRLSFGGVAAVVHPGPTFSATDERLGLGQEGAPVPGLAQALAALNRFGLFGNAPGGGGPDGTVLRRIGLEWKHGEHLGIAFAGLVAWCEGADVPSRPVRAGAGVSGAALHEGYWIDVESVRDDHERQESFLRELAELPEGALVEALAERGPTLSVGAAASEAARLLAPLGEGQRLLVAVLRERGAATIGLEELLANTALHEEGHLTERTRFLPLARHWPAVLSFALRHGLLPRALARALEYRAQLVALCAAEEPRLVLADCLGAADESGGYLAHGEAYRALVEDFLAELVARRTEFPGLDPARYALYQLHTLTRAEVRTVALALARREGLVAPGYEPPPRLGE